MTKELWCDSRKEQEISSPNCPTWPWGPTIPYSIEKDALHWECNSQDVNLTTHFHLVLKLQMHRAIPPLLNTPSWCGDPSSKEVTFTLCCLVLFNIYDAAWQFLWLRSFSDAQSLGGHDQHCALSSTSWHPTVWPGLADEGGTLLAHWPWPLMVLWHRIISRNNVVSSKNMENLLPNW